MGIFVQYWNCFARSLGPARLQCSVAGANAMTGFAVVAGCDAEDSC